MDHPLDDIMNNEGDVNDKIRNVTKVADKMKTILAKREDLSAKIKLILETSVSDVDFLLTISDTVDIYEELSRCAAEGAQLMREIAAAIRATHGPAQ